jgi:hypothetical protein
MSQILHVHPPIFPLPRPAYVPLTATLPRLLNRDLYPLRNTDVLQASQGGTLHENAIIAVIGIIICGTGEEVLYHYRPETQCCILLAGPACACLCVRVRVR